MGRTVEQRAARADGGAAEAKGHRTREEGASGANAQSQRQAVACAGQGPGTSRLRGKHGDHLIWCGLLGVQKGGWFPEESTRFATVVRGPNGIITAYPDLGP